MAFQPGTIQTLLASRAYQLASQLGAEAIDAFVRAGLRVKNSGIGNPPDVQTKLFTAQTNTPASVSAGPARAYGFYAKSPAAATLDVIVQLTDADVVIGSCKVTATKAGEVFLFAGSDGIGVPCATDLEVLAVAAANGSSNPAAGDRPDITVLFGQP